MATSSGSKGSSPPIVGGWVSPYSPSFNPAKNAPSGAAIGGGCSSSGGSSGGTTPAPSPFGSTPTNPFSQKGSYNPNTCVYTSPTGQQQSRASAPTGAVIVGATPFNRTYVSRGSSGGGGGSPTPSGNGAVVQTVQGGVSYPSMQQALIAQQKLNQQSSKIDLKSDTYGKSNLYGVNTNKTSSDVGFYKDGKYYPTQADYIRATGSSSFNPAAKPFSVTENIKRYFSGLTTAGNKPLNNEDKAILSRQLGGAGFYIGGNKYSPTATGRGTTFTGVDLSKQEMTKYNYADEINFRAKIKSDALVKNKQDKIIGELKPLYTYQLNSAQSDLQGQVNSGLISVEDANKQLSKIADDVNKKFLEEANTKIKDRVTIPLNQIEQERNNLIIRAGLTPAELEKQVGKLEAKTGITKETIKVGAEIAAVTIASAVNPALGYGVGLAIGGAEIAKSVQIEQQKNIPLLEIRKDANGNINVVKVGEKISPEAIGQYLYGASFILPAAYGSTKLLTKEITTLSAERLAGKGLVTMEDLNKGFVKVNNFNFATGKMVDTNVLLRAGTKPIENVKAIMGKGITYEQLVNEGKLALGEAKPNVNPFKIQELTIPQQKGVSDYTTKIFGLELPNGRAIVIGARSAEGKLNVGVPNILKQLQAMPTTTEIKLATSLETETLYKNLLRAGPKSTTRAKELIPAFRKLLGRTYNKPSKFIDEKLLYEQTQYLPKKGVNIFLDLAKENKGVLFGSKARAYQLAPEYKIAGKTFKLTKVPRDVEVRFDQLAENDLKALTDKSIKQLKELSVIKEKGTTFDLASAREIKDTPFAIEAKINGKFEKVAELKGAGNLLENEIVSEKVIGFTKEGKPLITSKGIPTTSLAEELRGVSQGVLRVRNVKFIEGGNIKFEELSGRTLTTPFKKSGSSVVLKSNKEVTLLDIYPSPKRMKDIGSVSVSARTLQQSGSRISKPIAKIESLFPERLVREQVEEVLKNPQREAIASFINKPSAKINFNKLSNLKSPPIKLKEEYKSPSQRNIISDFKLRSQSPLTTKSLSASLSKSPLKYSPYKSPSRSPSPYPTYKSLLSPPSPSKISPSLIKSPSPYKSISPSPIKSPSPYINYPSPYTPYPPVALKGRNSLLLGESRKFNPQRFYPQKKPAYAASLGSAIFGFSKKVKAKDLKQTLAKLGSLTYSGFEQRPTIEVIPNKPIKNKINVQKAIKSLNFNPL